MKVHYQRCFFFVFFKKNINIQEKNISFFEVFHNICWHEFLFHINKIKIIQTKPFIFAGLHVWPKRYWSFACRWYSYCIRISCVSIQTETWSHKVAIDGFYFNILINYSSDRQRNFFQICFIVTERLRLSLSRQILLKAR